MAAAFFAAMSCNVFDDAEYADIRELAPSQEEILIPKEGGEADIKVYSNGKVTVNVLGDESAEWSEVTPLEFEGDGLHLNWMAEPRKTPFTSVKAA